ncbi:MAG: bacterial Ig-like domain-containing protein [Christensenellaceae bacterium]|nr:bacterial Ig-like domain-containing protein [Christensenellaceae bacterium]
MIFNLGGGAATPQLTSIAVTTQPTKMTYNVGDKFSKTGMVVTAYFDDGSSSVITGYSYSPTSALNMSTKTITISYTHEGITKTATVSITMQYVLYNRGTEHANTGGMAQTHGSKESNRIHVRITGETTAWVYTSNKISLSNCTTLKAIVGTYDAAETKINLGIGSSQKSFTAKTSPTVSYVQEQTISLSISSYASGSYYVQLSCGLVGVSGWAVYKIWLE